MGWGAVYVMISAACFTDDGSCDTVGWGAVYVMISIACFTDDGNHEDNDYGNDNIYFSKLSSLAMK